VAASSSGACQRAWCQGVPIQPWAARTARTVVHELVTRRELAEIMRVSVQTVDRLKGGEATRHLGPATGLVPAGRGDALGGRAGSAAGRCVGGGSSAGLHASTGLSPAPDAGTLPGHLRAVGIAHSGRKRLVGRRSRQSGRPARSGATPGAAIVDELPGAQPVANGVECLRQPAHVSACALVGVPCPVSRESGDLAVTDEAGVGAEG
jgi:hypothetical protein